MCSLSFFFSADNFGHEHHMHNHYKYRDNRPDRPGMTDGFDMMSGGNGYERADFGVASKWFFNWVSDSNIVSLQPEGQTEECPSCVNSGTFKMKAFDDWTKVPGENDIMGIFIPVMTQYDSSWGSDIVSWCAPQFAQIIVHSRFIPQSCSLLTFTNVPLVYRCIHIGFLIVLVWMVILQMECRSIWFCMS